MDEIKRSKFSEGASLPRVYIKPLFKKNMHVGFWPGITDRNQIFQGCN